MEENISLKEYFESRLVELEKRIESSRQSMEKRLDGMNEIKGAMKDQLATHPTREELGTELDSIKKELQVFAKFREERGSVPADIEFLKKDVRILTTFKDTMDGKASQSSVTLSYIFSVVGIIFGLVSLILNIIQSIK